MQSVTYLTLLLFFLVAGSQLPASAQIFSGSSQFGSSRYGKGMGVGTDFAGNVYVAGQHRWDTIVYPNWQGYRVCNGAFIDKYAPDGTLLWHSEADCSTVLPSWVDIRKLEVDEYGNSYLYANAYAGLYWPRQTNTTISGLSIPPYTEHYVIIKFSPDGNPLWSTPVNFELTDFTVKNNHIYITGTFNQIINVGYISLTPKGSKDEYGRYKSDIVVASLSALDATVSWVKRIGGYEYDSPVGVKADDQGNAYLCGNLSRTATLGSNIALPVESEGHVLIAKFSPAGGLLRSKLYGGPPVYYGGFNVHGFTINDTGQGYLSFYNTKSGLVLDQVPVQNNVNGNQLAQFDQDGRVLWVSNVGPYAYGNTIEIDGEMNTYQTYNFSGNWALQIGNQSFISAGGSDIVITKSNANGQLIWARQIGGQQDDQINSFVVHPNGNVYMTGFFSGSISLDGHVMQSIGEQDGFLAVLGPKPMTSMRGQVFLDSNSNGLWDTNETAADQVVVTTSPPSFVSVTDSQGWYQLRGIPGTFEIRPTVPQNHKLSGVLPQSTLSKFGETDTLPPIGITLIPGIKEVEANLVLIGAARPGFRVRFQITYTNTGTDPVSSTIRFQPDSALVYFSSAPTATLSPYQLDWSFTNLLPGHTRVIYADFTLPATFPIGDSLRSHLYVSAEMGFESAQYRHYKYLHIVTGSYDPNEKQVLSGTSLSTTQVKSRIPMRYQVQFQNTGTDTAFTVVVRDQLSDKVDVSSFRMLASSHACATTLSDQGQLEWTFSNILLPDSNTNEAASHGFVVYEVIPRTDLEVGTDIRNTAYIYFDFNAAVITNTTVTTVTSPPSAPAVSFEELTVFPNPTRGEVVIGFQSGNHEQVRLICYSSDGKTVISKNISFQNEGYTRQPLDMRGLPPGLYYLQLHSGDQVMSQKIVLE